MLPLSTVSLYPPLDLRVLAVALSVFLPFWTMVATFFLLCDNLACFLAFSLIQSKSLKPLGDNSKFCHPQGDQSFYSFIFPIAWNSDLIIMPYSGCSSFLALQESHLRNLKKFWCPVESEFLGMVFLIGSPKWLWHTPKPENHWLTVLHSPFLTLIPAPICLSFG